MAGGGATIAHEIKNPLTPIRISAERLLRIPRIARRRQFGRRRTEFGKLAAECASLIGREVETLESLVDEFSQFARFPAARLARADLNEIVRSAIEVFPDRLDGVTLRRSLTTNRRP